MAISEELRIEITAQSKQALKEMQGTEKAVGKLGTALTAAFGAAAVYAGIKKIGTLLLNASQIAADAEETFSKFTVVFKDQATEVEAWARTYSASVGRSSTETMKFASTLQDTFVPLGFAREEAGELSKKLVVLANDVGSFNNIMTDDVIRDFQSALVGNTETLRKYGVVASQAAIVEEALASGLISTASELDAASKAQAIYQIIVAGTADAQGDLLRTQDSTANTTIRLKTAVNDLGIVVGNVVNESLTPFKATLADIVTEYTAVLEASIKLKAALSDQKDGYVDINGQILILQARLDRGGLFRGQREEIEDQIEALQRLSAQMASDAAMREQAARDQRKAADDAAKAAEEAAEQARQDAADAIAAAEAEVALLLTKEQAIKAVAAARKEDREAAEGGKADREAEKIAARIIAAEELFAAERERVAVIEQLQAEARANQMARDEAEKAAVQTLADMEAANHAQKMANIQEQFDVYASYAQGTQQIFANLINSMMAGDAEMTDKRKKAIIALFRMQQVASIGQIAMNTASAIVEALPNIPLSIAVGAIGASQIVAAAAAKPPVKLAEGGIVMPTAGGTSAILGEAGQPEAVIPLDRFGSLGTTNNFYISGVVGSIEDVAIKINEGLESARHMGKVA